MLRLRRPWRDGTRALRFEPSEFLEKLAVVIPRSRIKLLLCHGAFAPRGRCHSGPVVGTGARQQQPVIGADQQRVTCGTIRPTKLIMPLTETAAPDRSSPSSHFVLDAERSLY